MTFNQKLMPIIIILIIIVVAAAIYFYFSKSRMSKNETRFTGKITAAKFDGKLDGDDYITVNGIQIKLAGGKSGSQNEWGKIIGIDLGQQESAYIGKTVNVYATKYIPKVTPENTFSDEMEDGRVSLEGSKNYFVEVTE